MGQAIANEALCEKCGTEIPYNAERCVGCGKDVGFPNVRAANQAIEISALHDRLRYAQEAAEARGCRTELEAFGTAVSQSRAVMMRSLGALNALASQSQAAMISYHKQVRSEAKIPENNAFDWNRARIDSAIHPHFVYENLQFAALSLDGIGVKWYGDYSLTFKEQMIGERTSVFEENPFCFLEKYPIPPTGTVKPGYRASWSRRSELAMAKLHAKIDSTTQESDFPSVLLQPQKSADSDFIEVHIYGVIHARAIERVVGSVPKRRADRILWNETKRALSALGVVVDEV